MIYYISIWVKSAASFGAGEGIPGFVDVEIDHDACGCPELGGRRLKGLLAEECANLRYALGSERWKQWVGAAEELFGRSGATDTGYARLHVGSATLPSPLRDALHAKVQAQPQQLTREAVLAAFTTLRRQTAVDPQSGAPEIGSLRTVRVLLRETPLIAQLEFSTPPGQETLSLLAACALLVRRGGSVRNRGRGRMSLLLHETLPTYLTLPNAAVYTKTLFEQFAQKLKVA
jgi:hypothetical protein